MSNVDKKYACIRDEFLDWMRSEGWANNSGGDIKSPVGRFALVKIDVSELGEITEAFSTEIDKWSVDIADLLGNFIVTNSDGVCFVRSFDHALLADLEFDRLLLRYEIWQQRCPACDGHRTIDEIDREAVCSNCPGKSAGPIRPLTVRESLKLGRPRA